VEAIRPKELPEVLPVKSIKLMNFKVSPQVGKFSWGNTRRNKRAINRSDGRSHNEINLNPLVHKSLVESDLNSSLTSSATEYQCGFFVHVLQPSKILSGSCLFKNLTSYTFENECCTLTF